MSWSSSSSSDYDAACCAVTGDARSSSRAGSKLHMTPSLLSKNKNAVSLLYARELGITSTSIFAGKRRLRSADLASTIAWNPRRFHNMILVVGPGTPAAVAGSATGQRQQPQDDDDSSSSSADAHPRLRNVATDEDDVDDMQLERSSSNSDEASSSENAEDEDSEPAQPSDPHRSHNSSRSEEMEEESWNIATESRTSRRYSEATSSVDHSSIRHGGCINTACWLDTPWRLSTVNEEAGILRSTTSTAVVNDVGALYESPTQLVTSGDDRLVKFWDLAGAMGMDNPLPGGWNTLCPFATTMVPCDDDDDDSNGGYKSKWNQYYADRSDLQRPLNRSGRVQHVATLSTAHRGNVFHVTPLSAHPGKVLTCGADGFLRLGDLVNDSSSVVMSSYTSVDEDDLMNSLFVFQSRMAYSHVLVTPNTGLLCSDRGLHHFDIRLPPRQQTPKKSLLEDYIMGNGGGDADVWRSGLCKTCAIWSPHVSYGNGQQQSQQHGSNYVFAGGASETVGLYDLRMDGSGTKVVERYKPKWLEDTGPAGSGKVSVSGLDVSRDGKELLVSYESDQIYAFPILNGPAGAASSAGVPTVEEINRFGKRFQDCASLTQSELACFGGHLNRFTFLKNARYAGPNDEYVCTGSDSGHAWFYDRRDGTVASLLGADTSTCNGVIPHPNLPFFVTYGIDTTAKVWRATLPVDPETDDSPAGRLASSQTQPYEMSPVARDWAWVKYQLSEFEDLEPPLMPDAVASREEMISSSRFSAPCRRGIYLLDSPRLGNALQSLPMILRQNHFECCRAIEEEMDPPVEHPLSEFTKRVGICRLKHQCDRLGLRWQPWRPRAFSSDILDVHPADLIPDFPSDWISYDPELGGSDEPARCIYNLKDHHSNVIAAHFPGFYEGASNDDKPTEQAENSDDESPSVKEESDDDVGSHGSECQRDKGDTEMEMVNKETRRDMTTRNERLFVIVKTLREGGNVAMKSGLLRLAARRYDKAIQYCAVAFLYHEQGRADYEALGIQEKFIATEWSPLLEQLIMCRLNMALVLLKPEFSLPDRASDQAQAAIRLLLPFTVEKGKVIGIRKKDGVKVHLRDEPESTYNVALALQGKACFRLGSAELALGKFSLAIRNFEWSLKFASTEQHGKPDPLTIRRLNEARRRQKNKKKRNRGSEEKGRDDSTMKARETK